MKLIEHQGNPPPDWIDALDRSKAQVDAGQTVPAEPVLQRLRAGLARLEARQPKKHSKL